MWCGKIHRRDLGAACDVEITHWSVAICRQLPANCIVLWHLSEKTPSDWATATVAEEWFLTTADGTLPCGRTTVVIQNLIKAVTRATSAPFEKLRFSRLRWEVLEWRRTSFLDVRARRVLLSHLRCCGWDTSGSSA